MDEAFKLTAVGGDRVRGANLQAVKEKTRVTRKGRPSWPEPPAGRPMTGVVGRIVRGQSYGFIQTTEHREVFFHRSDVTRSSFNDLATGDPVTFRLTDDTMSGPRATHIRKGH
jgi:cold shock CspA family protein